MRCHSLRTSGLTFFSSSPRNGVSCTCEASRSASTVRHSTLGNPAPLGWFAFVRSLLSFSQVCAAKLRSLAFFQALNTLLLSLILVQARGVTVPNAGSSLHRFNLYSKRRTDGWFCNKVVGLALGYGFVSSTIAGIFELYRGNTLSATAFTSYGGYWIS